MRTTRWWMKEVAVVVATRGTGRDRGRGEISVKRGGGAKYVHAFVQHCIA